MAVNIEYADHMRVWALRYLLSPYSETAFRYFYWRKKALMIGLPFDPKLGSITVGKENKKVNAFDFFNLGEEEKNVHFSEMLESEQANLPEWPNNTHLSKNITRLARELGLTEIEQEVLALAILSRQEPALEAIFETAEKLTPRACIQLISILLERSEQDIKTVLSVDGKLSRSGILKLSRSMDCLARILIMPDDFSARMIEPQGDTRDLLRGHLASGAPCKLNLGDFDYLQDDLDIVMARLKESLRNKTAGVNILLYGVPGGGKTELARVIAKELGVPLYEISAMASDGDILSASGRFSSYQFSQALLGISHDCLVLFDEIEDIFPKPSEWFSGKEKPTDNKAFINSSLESNPVPTIWLSNSIRPIDPAYLRRFDYVMEVRIPPVAMREKLIKRYLPKIDPAWASQAAKCEHLTPALIERSAKVYASAGDELPESNSHALLARIMDSSLRAQGHKRGLPSRSRADLDYDPAYLNADSDLESICIGLLDSREGRLCFYGPPGTGKTAFGHYVARLLGQPLITKRVSDLVSPWIGETEKNIADAFYRAERDRAVLLIDEADSFLMDRQHARHQWQITQVNEMLTCMEEFQGVFIASTNLMDNLDKASIRRFDFKIRFDFLLPEQAWHLFENLCNTLSLPVPHIELKTTLAHIKGITPGNYATVARQSRLRKIINCEDALDALRQECVFNQESHGRRIGFSA